MPICSRRYSLAKIDVARIFACVLVQNPLRFFALLTFVQDFSDWPTIPQLYLGGEFVGGADIVIELFQSGELQEMIEVAAAS